MSLRIRVRLPDRPGSLGRVARTLGAAGADVVQMAVLERGDGRALDDFTVLWPAGACVERLRDGLGSVPGVAVEGIWPTGEPRGAFPDAAVIGQVAAFPERGAEILADAVPAILSAAWAGLAEVGAGGAAGFAHLSPGGP
ncbi:ACT domain-containing protein, partial [Actinomadura roseirufa]|uniref:ACT domain-containing protein n=1 Tax=Actinomadura roseirufa TaxID=2094049 RepID=UPI00104156B7